MVVPLEFETTQPELSEVPPPLDPMADPGIASAEIHPVPPVPVSVARVGAGRGKAPGAGEEDLQAEGGAAGAGPGGPGSSPVSGGAGTTGGAGSVAGSSEGTATAEPTRGEDAGVAVDLSPLNLPPVNPPPRLQPRAPAAAPVPAPATREGLNEPTSQPPLRLVATRPMWDGGAFVQHSPSVASLYRPLELRANPDDLGRLGVAQASRVRVSAEGKQASVVVTAIGDPLVPSGTVVLPFNLPGDGAGLLIDASVAVTEISLEKLEG